MLSGMRFLHRPWGQSKPGSLVGSEAPIAPQFRPAEHQQYTSPPYVNLRRGLPADGVQLRGTGRVLVAGESRYRPAFLEVTGGRTKAGVSVGVLTALVPEPHNRKDPNAIAVLVGGLTIGHLDRADARAYSPVIDRLASERRVAYCNATIYGGWDRGGRDRGNFGVSLELASATSLLLGLGRVATGS
jgi:hypothetical protein